jgi:hypothetical protein
MLEWEHIDIIIYGLINYIYLGGTNFKRTTNSWNQNEKTKHWLKYYNGLKFLWGAIFDHWNCGDNIISFWLWSKIWY